MLFYLPNHLSPSKASLIDCILLLSLRLAACRWWARWEALLLFLLRPPPPPSPPRRPRRLEEPEGRARPRRRIGRLDDVPAKTNILGILSTIPFWISFLDSDGTLILNVVFHVFIFVFVSGDIVVAAAAAPVLLLLLFLVATAGGGGGGVVGKRWAGEKNMHYISGRVRYMGNDKGFLIFLPISRHIVVVSKCGWVRALSLAVAAVAAVVDVAAAAAATVVDAAAVVRPVYDGFHELMEHWRLHELAPQGEGGGGRRGGGGACE